MIKDKEMPGVLMHGVCEQETKNIHLQSFERLGFFVIKAAVPSEKVVEIRDKLYGVYETQVNEVGGAHNLKKINDDNIARALFAYDSVFLKDVLNNPNTLPYLEILLDKNYTLYSQVGVFSRPQSELYQVAWHREILYQHYTTSRPLAVQTLFILNEFNETTGGTLFLPGSHLFEKFPCDEFVLKNQTQPILEAGDVVVMNSMLYHRAGINRSNMDRLLITNTFVRPILASQFNYTAMVDPQTLSEQEAQMLGFRWDYNKTMLDWRLGRIRVAKELSLAQRIPLANEI